MGFTSEKAKLEHDRTRLERELGEAQGELRRLRASIVDYRLSDQVGCGCNRLGFEVFNCTVLTGEQAFKDQVTAAQAEVKAAKRDLKASARSRFGLSW